MPAPKKRLSNIAIRYQVLLERLKAGEVREFVKVFAQIDKATARILTELAVENLGQLTKKALTKVLSDLQKANVELIDEATADLFDKLESISGHAAVFEVATVKAVVKGVKLATPTMAEAYAAAKAQPLSATGQMLDSFVSDWSKREVSRVNDLVRKGYAEGWTNQQMVQGIRGTRALGYKDGLLASSRRNAEAVVRTSVQHVANTGRMAVWEQNKDIVQGYKFVATLDARTTQICRSLDGKVFKLGEGPVPPVHIGCRSTTIAELDPELDFLDEGATRSSEFGPVPADQTYYEWLKEQPAAFQDEALGPTRAALFRDGGLSAEKFAELNLGRNFQPLTLEQMQAKAPVAFAKAGIET